jgi:type II secretory pathway pseudopilin PulG
MQINQSLFRREARGFTLPAILVVVGALLIIAVASLLIVGIERNTSRAFSDRERANLAARAGLEDVRNALNLEASNDDYLVVQHADERKPNAAKDPAPYLYIARGSVANTTLKYRYVPLFSTEQFPTVPVAGSPLKAPEAESLVGASPQELKTLPWLAPARLAWIYLKDSKGKNVSRYAYWVEDLQGKIDGRVAGNIDGEGGIHCRAEFPDPPAKPKTDNALPASAIAIHVMDPESGDKSKPADQSGKTLTQKIIDGRPAMLSPDSMVGATGLFASGSDALQRNPITGLLSDPTAASLEREASPVNQSYLEQAVVPFAPGLSEKVVGKPKLNLNKLLTGSRSSSVDDMAKWIDDAMPEFMKTRKGGFPDDYLKTLAAGALDYADKDNDPTIQPGSYLGMDAYPLLSEIVLHIEFLGSDKVGSRYVLKWRFRLFAELWNMTNQPVTTGSARLSYEVNLQPETIGASAESLPFDTPSILKDPLQSTHNLTEIDGKFYGPVQSVTLQPDEYQFYEFATVNYTLDYSPSLRSNGQPKVAEFDLLEPELEARGITLLWNDKPVHTIQGIVRDAYGVSNFRTNTPRITAKAAIPGHSYGPFGIFVNNMGDPRISNYLRTTRLGDNAYPENISPGRRNIRRGIYDRDTSRQKNTHYGRVLPSEWPDGGHDSPTGAWTPIYRNDILPTDTDSTSWPAPPTPRAENAPQRISNLDRFYSTTELGHVYDPVLWKPTYSDLEGFPGSGKEDTEILTREKFSAMPSTRNCWPDVSLESTPSSDYGGGNTLRIGRPEHPMFDKPGKRAAQLLDLFHVGIATSENVAETTGGLVEVRGNININTAGKDAIRAMAAGLLQQDPELRRVTSWDHEPATAGLFRPKTTTITLGSPTVSLVADQIADALMLGRPFSSASEIASILNKDGIAVFGNRLIYTNFKEIQWSDAAAEELFSRVYDASTVRSRNFRIWVIGQAISGTEASPVVLAESKRAFTVFADPGIRKSDDTIDPTKFRMKVNYENDF